MKICKKCGALINDDARFCTRCGTDTTENAEPSAQPQTEYYEPANNGDVYYQPGNDSSNGNTDTYQSQPTVYQQPTPKKGKFPVWIIAVIVVAAISAVAAVGSANLFGKTDGKVSISEGYDTETEYINTSLNLKIDSSKGPMEIMSDQYRDYYGASESGIESFIADMESGENIYIRILEGSFYETNQDIKAFTKETIEYWYEEYPNAVISDVYEREIAGITYTCADVSETVSDYEYGDYYLETTICFLKDGSTFFEIDITTYPEETGNNTDSIIKTYISPYAE